jgi:hypothetical protein
MMKYIIIFVGISLYSDFISCRTTFHSQDLKGLCTYQLYNIGSIIALGLTAGSLVSYLIYKKKINVLKKNRELLYGGIAGIDLLSIYIFSRQYVDNHRAYKLKLIERKKLEDIVGPWFDLKDADEQKFDTTKTGFMAKIYYSDTNFETEELRTRYKDLFEELYYKDKEWKNLTTDMSAHYIYSYMLQLIYYYYHNQLLSEQNIDLSQNITYNKFIDTRNSLSQAASDCRVSWVDKYRKAAGISAKIRCYLLGDSLFI